MLVRSPGFSLIVIATMALGIGATSAIYSVIDATLLHPLPYSHPTLDQKECGWGSRAGSVLTE
jgi:hypothetical protein